MTAAPRILVAEDDPALRRLLEVVLEQVGEVVLAEDGQEALEIARRGPPPDVVVTDVMMPRMDGLTLAATLRDDAALGAVPVVVLTARTDTKDIVAGISAGARYYLTKPFETDDLVAKVRRALGEG